MKTSALVRLIKDESYKHSTSDFWTQSFFLSADDFKQKINFWDLLLKKRKIMLTAVWRPLSLSDLKSIHVKLSSEDPTKLFFAIITQSFLKLSVNSIFSNLSVHEAFATPKIEEIIAVKNLIFGKHCDHSNEWFLTWIGNYQSKHFIRRCKGEMPNSKLASWVGKTLSFWPIVSGLAPHIGQLLLQSVNCSCHIDLVCPSMSVRSTWKSISMSVSGIL